MTDCPSLADATGRALISLILESAGIASDAVPTESFVKRLSELSNADNNLREWIETVECAQQKAFSSAQPVDSPSGALTVPKDRLLQLAQNLPEAVARDCPTLRCVNESTTSDLSRAAHLATRIRAIERNVSTELRSRQNQSLYHIAYGLSHELNNPLAIIVTRAGVLAAEEADHQRKMLLESIISNAMRGCEMLGDLMLVARPPKLVLQQVPACAFFEELLEQSRSWAGPFSVTIVDDIHVGDSLYIDRTSMLEALWCLIRNAIEALPSCGQITFRVTQLDGASQGGGPTVPQNGCQHNATEGWVRITVEDNGPQLSREALAHCFDPYYSGREAGRGLGLGLTKSLRIVSLHGGDLQIANLSTGGCIATVEIPL